MDKYMKDSIVMKILSILGIGFNTILLLVILFHDLNLFTFIFISLCFIGIYYPSIKKYKAYKVLAGIGKSNDENAQSINDDYKPNVEIDLFSVGKRDIFNNTDTEFDKENEINIKIIDDLRLRNIKLNNKLKVINEDHEQEIRDLEQSLERLEQENSINLESVKKQYEHKIDLLEKQIKNLSILTDEKRNELKEEALYEYLSLMKEDYHRKLNGGNDTKVMSVSTYVAGVKHNNPNGESRQKIIKKYLKENHDIDLFDKNDFNYVSNKEIEEESGYVFGKKYYRYELEEFDTIRLYKELDNLYDENAIGIIHEEMGHIGYIPREDTDKVKKLLDISEKLEYRLKFYGGSYKYYDENEYKVKTDSTTYSFKLFINCV